MRQTFDSVRVELVYDRRPDIDEITNPEDVDESEVNAAADAAQKRRPEQDSHHRGAGEPMQEFATKQESEARSNRRCRGHAKHRAEHALRRAERHASGSGLSLKPAALQKPEHCHVDRDR